MRYFNFNTIAQQAHISPNQLEVLKKLVSQEFPKDDMMLELHLLRVCSAIRDGHVSFEEAVNPKRAA